MPWHSSVGAIVAAWYPGIGGAQAIADILFGDVDPSGKLPVTFAAAEADLPHPQVPGLAAMPQPKRDSEGMVVGDPPKPKPFDVDYTEGSQVGYKWFDANRKEPLFPFGFGLSYTTFAYGELKVDTSHRCVTFRVKNTGHREGTEIAEVYVQLPIRAGENFKRLAGWTRVKLAPGEESSVTVPLDPRTLSLFDTEKHRLELPEGDYTVLAGPSSRDTPLSAKANFR
jgi:beta-glucosidase